jgi:hypothetical protein
MAAIDWSISCLAGPLMVLSGSQLPPRDRSAIGHKADLRERRTDVGYTDMLTMTLMPLPTEGARAKSADRVTRE